GEALKLIRPPIPEFTVLGGMMVDRDDIPHLMKIGKSLASTVYSARIIGKYYLSRLRHGRDSRLLMGNALIGRMLAAALRLGVDIVTQAQTVALVSDGAAVTGLTLRQNGADRQVAVDGGIV